MIVLAGIYEHSSPQPILTTTALLGKLAGEQMRSAVVEAMCELGVDLGVDVLAERGARERDVSAGGFAFE